MKSSKYVLSVGISVLMLWSNYVLAEFKDYAPKVIKKISASPVIDGKLDDKCWNDAEKWPLLNYKNSNQKQIPGGNVSICYDEKNLYVALYLEEPELEKVKSPKCSVNDIVLWQGDVLECFINTEPDKGEYLQFAWNLSGSQFNKKFSEPGVESITKYNPEWKTVSCKGNGVWKTEAIIPFSSLGLKTPTDGVEWSMNLTRTRIVTGITEYSVMSSTSGGFHQPDCFASIWFNKYIQSEKGTVNNSDQLKVLLGCWDTYRGYTGMFDIHNQLDRALGKENVEIRTFLRADGNKFYPIRNWPKKIKELLKYKIIILTGFPVSVFSDMQIKNLHDYISEGGHLIIVGTYSDFKNWYNTPIGNIMPVEIQSNTRSIYRISNINSEVFNNIPFDKEDLKVMADDVKLVNNGKTVVIMSANVNGSIKSVPFIAENLHGTGSIVFISGFYWGLNHNPPKDFNQHFVFSKYYGLFWDDLIKYITGHTVKNPAVINETETKKIENNAVGVSFDIIKDNYGDLFKPNGLIRLLLEINGEIDYPCNAKAVIKEKVNQKIVYEYNFSLKEKLSEIKFHLPYLDRGIYNLELIIDQSGKKIASYDEDLKIVLPLIDNDEFNFLVYITNPYSIGMLDSKRIANYLKSIGFNSVGWLGGTIIQRGYGVYPYYESRFVSCMQAEGLRVQPVLYPLAYEILQSNGKKYPLPGKIDKASGLPMPDPAFPGKNLLPWNYYWLDLFGEKAYGRMPLTTGFAVGDEFIGLTIPVSQKIKDDYQKLAKKANRENISINDSYDFFKYYLKISANFLWFSNSIYKAYNNKWDFDSIVSPNSLCNHTSAIIDPTELIGTLGSTSPDVYPYGEKKLYQKTLHEVAMVLSATDFGKLSKVGLTPGDLLNNYYWAFPEQVFSGISAGAKFINVFTYGTTSFEKNGRTDEKFAAIAKKTTEDAQRIGSTLNHYQRERGRVAMLYPQTAYMHLCMGKSFNDDYLKMAGKSAQYIDLMYVSETQYDVLRRMAGHVDIIYDSQIQRGDLKNYDVLVIGYCKQMEERTIRDVKSFISKGGTVLISTDSGRFNEYNKETKLLYDILPASPGKEKEVSVDYSETRTRAVKDWNKGNALIVKKDAEILFSFPDNDVACARGKIGSGEVIVLGMPWGALNTEVNKPKYKLIEYLINQNSHLISKSQDREFSAITFLPNRGNGRIFMIFNGNKENATTTVTAFGDETEADSVLVDIVKGEKIPFAVKDNVLSFKVDCPAVWGRALALLENEPATLEASISGIPIAGEKFLYAVRILRKDGQPIPNTLPLDIIIKSPDGKIRDDLSGIRIAEKGIYVFSFTWPVNMMKGKWTLTASEKISGSSDTISWANN